MKNTITMIQQSQLNHLASLEFRIAESKKETAKLLAEHEDVEAPIPSSRRRT